MREVLKKDTHSIYYKKNYNYNQLFFLHSTVIDQFLVFDF